MLDIEQISQDINICKSDLVIQWVLPIPVIEEMIALIKRQEIEIREQVALNAAQIRVIDSMVAQPVAAQHDSDCAQHNAGVPELLGPCDCSIAAQQHAQAALSDYDITMMACDIALQDDVWEINDADLIPFVRRCIAASQQPAAAPAAPAKRPLLPREQALCNDGSEPNWSAYAAAEASPAVQVQDEREAFEAWARTACSMPDDAMVNWDALWTKQAWEGWQARAVTSPAQPALVQQRAQTVLSDEQIKAISRDVGMLASHDGKYMRSAGTHGGMNVEDGISSARAILAASQQPAARAIQAQDGAYDAEADLQRVYDVFGIGKEARSIGVLLTNVRNCMHFFELMTAVEREFFMVPGEPDDDYPNEEPQDECLVNSWGSTQAEYIEQFRAALAKIAAPSPAQPAPVASAPAVAVPILADQPDSDFRQCLRSFAMRVAEEGIKEGHGRTMSVTSDRCRAVVNGVMEWDIGKGLIYDLLLAAQRDLAALQPAAAPVAAAVAQGETAWRVAEFWSSANPDKKVPCLAVGHEITIWEKRKDFIRWLSPAATQPLADVAPVDAPTVNTSDINWPRLPLLKAEQDLLTWVESKHRPPKHDMCGTMVLVRLDALATLADSIADAIPAQPSPAQGDAMSQQAIIKDMVNRFLGWKLPKTFNPDCGISFKSNDAPGGSWPIGTNMLTADEATAMFEHCLPAAIRALNKTCAA